MTFAEQSSKTLINVARVWMVGTMLFLSSNVYAVPTDGRVFWSNTDKNPSINLSEGQLTVSSTAPQYAEVGVRGNRPLNPGEGFYYFEVDQVQSSMFSAGVATAASPLNELAGFSDQAAGYNHEGRIGFNNGFSSELANPSDTVGIAVDYRGAHPIVHFIGAENGGSAQYLASAEMTSVHEPLYFFLALSDHSGVDELFRLNLGSRAFVFDPVPIIETRIYRGGDELQMGWPIDNDAPSVAITEDKTVALQGDSLTFNAQATDLEDGGISQNIQWYLNDAAVGLGAQVTISPAAGDYALRAVIEDSAQLQADATVAISVISDSTIDSDYDNLSYAQELLAGSNPALRDTDGDLLSDDLEVAAHSNPTLVDTDNDGMDDKYEVDNGLDPLTDDSAADADNDSFSNLVEAQARRKANDVNDYPGYGRVILNSLDASANITIASDQLSFSVNANSGLSAVRGDVAILPQSGWHYYEGVRLAVVGNYGFGVATASASLSQAAGSDNQSVGVSSLGEVSLNGSVQQNFVNPERVETYGIAVDYTGATPTIHIMLKRGHEDYEVLTPIVMTGISEALHIFAYSAEDNGQVQQRINTGEDKNAAPFVYPARYLLYRNGYTSAEFMRNGWGTAHSYQPLTSIPLENDIFFVKDERVNDGLTLSEDKLGASYTILRKSAVLANQGMIGEFRYWEAQRHIEVENIGFGFNNPYAFLDPYCCVNHGLDGGPPSMSVNAVGGIWRNLQYQTGYPRVSDTYYYGFAVDYRGSRPIVYVITLDGVAGSLLLDDFITEIYPMIYADGQGPRLTNSANFGAKPFFYNARQALQDYGVDTTDFIPGWGIYEQETVFGNVSPRITSTASTTVNEGQTYTYTLNVFDPDDLDLATDLSFSLSNQPEGMTISNTGVINWTPAANVSTSGSVTVTVVDGGEHAAIAAMETFSVNVIPLTTPTPTPLPTATPSPTATPLLTPTPLPTATPVPTTTPEPTTTPRPVADGYVVVIGTVPGEGVYANDNQNTQLIGLNGDENLIGQGGDDELIGGPGNDLLEGAAGADTYVYNLGDGSDYIANYDELAAGEVRADILKFGSGITPDDIDVAKSGVDLVLTVLPTNDTITVGFHFFNWDGEYRAELSAIVFDDGTRFDAGSLRVQLLGTSGGDDIIHGDERSDVIESEGGNDTAYGHQGNDFIFGGTGEDLLYGNEGDDFIGGGPGNDFLQGGPGDDRYVYELGDGNDRINNYEDDILPSQRNDILAFGDGISPSDVTLTQSNNDLIFTVLPTGETITIMFYFTDIDGGRYAGLSGATFLDGTTWYENDIQSILTQGAPIGNNSSIVGTDEDDVLFGTEGDNILIGGIGDDWLFGDLGNDEYRFTLGDGNDTIVNIYAEQADIDVLTINSVSHDQVWFQQDNENLIIRVVGTEDTITVNSWFNDAANQLDRINANGLSINRTDVNTLQAAMAAYSAPVGAQGTIPANAHGVLDPIISALWQ